MLVPDSFIINYDQAPEFIPMLLRTKYSINNGIRPNVLINVPVVSD